MLPYIIQIIAFQTFFLFVFDAFLKKETFFNWNRIYLLSTAGLSIILPFIKINRFKDIVPKQYIIQLPEIFIGEKPQQNVQQIILDTMAVEPQNNFIWEKWMYLGALIATFLFVFKIIKIIRLLTQSQKSKIGGLHIVELVNSTAAFSFFNFIFLGDQITETDKASILKHEIVHVKQKHTLDLLFFEAMRIVFWFNPLVYMYQNRMIAIHEFIAD